MVIVTWHVFKKELNNKAQLEKFMLSLRSKKDRLKMQGFSCSPESGVTEIEKWLKLTPAISTLWIFAATMLASPIWLWVFSIISAIGSVSDRHLFDWVYNSWLRNYSKTQLLPVNPKPRRFAMFLAAAWSAFTGWLFLSDIFFGAFISGLLLTCAGLLVATIHFCLGSWLYRIVERYKFKGLTTRDN